MSVCALVVNSGFVEPQNIFKAPAEISHKMIMVSEIPWLMPEAEIQNVLFETGLVVCYIGQIDRTLRNCVALVTCWSDFAIFDTVMTQSRGSEECIICLCHPVDEITFCGHRFHSACLDVWLNTSPTPTCPICRKKTPEK